MPQPRRHHGYRRRTAAEMEPEERVRYLAQRSAASKKAERTKRAKKNAPPVSQRGGDLAKDD